MINARSTQSSENKSGSTPLGTITFPPIPGEREGGRKRERETEKERERREKEKKNNKAFGCPDTDHQKWGGALMGFPEHVDTILR